MKFVMRKPQILLAVAGLLFLGFLVSPGFVDSVTGHRTVNMLPGYGAVAWWVVVLPGAAAHSRRHAVVLLSLLLAQVAFLVVPALVVLGRFRPLALRVFFGLLFVAGLFSMAWLIGRSEYVEFGVYLWLLAAVAAATFCLWPQPDT